MYVGAAQIVLGRYDSKKGAAKEKERIFIIIKYCNYNK